VKVFQNSHRFLIVFFTSSLLSTACFSAISFESNRSEADTGIWPDATSIDAGMIPDAGFSPDAMTVEIPDSGIYSGIYICPDSPGTSDELYFVEDSDCSPATSNLPSLYTGVWVRARDAVTSTVHIGRTLSSTLSEKNDTFFVEVYPDATLTSSYAVSHPTQVVNTPPSIPALTFEYALPANPNVYESYGSDGFAKLDDLIRCQTTAEGMDVDGDPRADSLVLRGTRANPAGGTDTTFEEIDPLLAPRTISRTLGAADTPVESGDSIICLASSSDGADVSAKQIRAEVCERPHVTFSNDTDYVEMDSNDEFDLSDVGTMEAWILWSGGVEEGLIFSRWTATQDEVRLWIASDGALETNWFENMPCGCDVEASSKSPLSTAVYVRPHIWTHIAMVWQQLNSRISIQLFIDGQAVGDPSLPPNQNLVSPGDEGVPMLGHNRHRTGIASKAFKGSIAKFRITNQALYTATSTFSPDRNYGVVSSQTKVFIPLNEGMGTALSGTLGILGMSTDANLNDETLWTDQRCFSR